MTLLEAINKADAMRPNALDEQTKADLLFQLEFEIADMVKPDTDPKNLYPVDCELLMPDSHAEIYPLYLAAMIDFAQEETNLYMVDSQIANSAVAAAKAWWTRNHDPKTRKGFTVMH